MSSWPAGVRFWPVRDRRKRCLPIDRSWLRRARVNITAAQLGACCCCQGLILGSEGIEGFFLDFFQIEQSVMSTFRGLDQFVKFTWIALVSPILGILDKKDHQEVMIVVPVLMTNCHVSLEVNAGPVTIQTKYDTKS